MNQKPAQLDCVDPYWMDRFDLNVSNGMGTVSSALPTPLSPPPPPPPPPSSSVIYQTPTVPPRSTHKYPSQCQCSMGYTDYAPSPSVTYSNNVDANRQFATAICIFCSVLSMVLVLMYYLVGETAFRTILLIISFVLVLSLCLACFLRRPTLYVFGQRPATTQGSTAPFMLVVPSLLGSAETPVSADTVQRLQGPNNFHHQHFNRYKR